MDSPEACTAFISRASPLVWCISGELLWGQGYGLANVAQGKPVTLDTRFRIASITKTFTATAIMQLRDAGRLRLDDPVV